MRRKKSAAPRLMSFSEALPEITAAIAAKKRAEAVHELHGQFAERSGLFPVECRKLELRDCQFERRLKRNFHRI